jgi:hypothetical protein
MGNWKRLPLKYLQNEWRFIYFQSHLKTMRTINYLPCSLNPLLKNIYSYYGKVCVCVYPLQNLEQPIFTEFAMNFT